MPQAMAKLMQLKEYYQFQPMNSVEASPYIINQIILAISEKNFPTACKRIIDEFEVLNTQERAQLGPRFLENMWNMLTFGLFQKKAKEENPTQRKAT